MSARPISRFFASVAMVSASSMVILMALSCQKDGKMIASTRFCACPPSHHGSWLLFHACCFSMQHSQSFFGKFSQNTHPSHHHSAAIKRKKYCLKGFDLFKSSFGFSYSNPGWGKKRQIRMPFLSFYWVVEWLILKTCLKRQRRDVYAESWQVQIASNSPCQVLFA